MPITLDFQMKFGWSELFALAAVIISIATFWYTRAQFVESLPGVAVSSRTAIVLNSNSPNRQPELIAALPFMVTNRGGRAVTLLQLQRAQIAPLLQIVDSGITEQHNLEARVALIEASPDQDQVIPNAVMLARTQVLEFPRDIAETVESGRAKPFILVVRISDKNGGPIADTKIFFSCTIVFSDGTTHRIAQGFGFSQ
jgi:hypothetical protein